VSPLERVGCNKVQPRGRLPPTKIKKIKGIKNE